MKTHFAMPKRTLALLSCFLCLFSYPSILPAEEASLTYSIPGGTSYLGIPLLRPAVMQGQINSVSSSDRLKVTLSEHIPLAPQARYFLEITSAPHDPTLEGERWNLWVSGASVTFPQAEIQLRLDHAGNTRSDLPANLVNCLFSVHPHWTLSSVLGGGSSPSQLQARKLISSADRVTLERGGVASTYFLEQASGHPHGRWRHTRGISSDPSIDPGHGLILERKGGLLRLTLTGEVRRHLLRRPLSAGLNLISLPSLKASTIRDLQLTALQGWRPEDQLTLWRGSSPRRYRWQSGTDQWVGLDSVLGTDPELAPLLQPTAAVLLKKAAADPDFALRPVP